MKGGIITDNDVFEYGAPSEIVPNAGDEGSERCFRLQQKSASRDPRCRSGNYEPLLRQHTAWKSPRQTGEVARPAYTMLAGSVEVSQPLLSLVTSCYTSGESGLIFPVGTNCLQSNRSWQIPLIFQAWACGLVIVLVWFIPESPRYLLARGRDQEAFDFLVKYREWSLRGVAKIAHRSDGNGDPNSALVALEIQEMREGIALDGADKRWWDCKLSQAGAEADFQTVTSLRTRDAGVSPRLP